MEGWFYYYLCYIPAVFSSYISLANLQKKHEGFFNIKKLCTDKICNKAHHSSLLSSLFITLINIAFLSTDLCLQVLPQFLSPE